MTYKEYPTWLEVKLYTASKDELEDLYMKHELLLDPRKYAIFFFGATTTLNAQEYKFLKAILTKKGERVKAEKLMKQIKSECKLESRKNLSYRIKSKIKKKLKDVAQKFIPLEGNEWVVTDRYPSTVYEKVDGFNKKFSYQDFDFERYFDMLISVKDGYYFTSFKPAS